MINNYFKNIETTSNENNSIIIKDYNLLKKSFIELRNDYLLSKNNYDKILDEKRKLETELIKIKHYLNDVNKQLRKNKEIIKQKNNELINIKKYNKNIESNLEKLNLNLEEIKNEKNELNIELNKKIQINEI